MNFYSLLLVLSCVLISKGSKFDISQMKFVDMSHVFDENTLFYNGRRYFNLSTFAIYDTKYFWAKCNQFCSVEHGGTHIDAPSHFIKDAANVGDLTLEQLIGPAVIINVVQQVEKNRDYEVTVSDIETWEKKNGQIPDNAMIFVHSNWYVRWPDPIKVFGEAAFQGDEKSVTVEKHYPGLSESAANWLVKNRPKLNGVGIDTPSVDRGLSKTFPAHRILSKYNHHILENVANLDKVPNFATIIALPMKIREGTGAPTRVIALIPRGSPGACIRSSLTFVVLFSLVSIICLYK